RAALDRADAPRRARRLRRRRQRAQRGAPRCPHPLVCSVAASRLGMVISRYSRPAMARVWSEERKLELWLEVELAALDAWVELGAAHVDAARRIRERAKPPSPERVAELELRTNHDLAAFVDAVTADLGDDGRFVHYGLTSSDVVDTALALQTQD